MVKNLLAVRETWVQSLVGKIPWRRKWQPTPVFLPGKFHGQKGLVGCSPWGRKEQDTTERRPVQDSRSFTLTLDGFPHCSVSFRFLLVFPAAVVCVGCETRVPWVGPGPLPPSLHVDAGPGRCFPS